MARTIILPTKLAPQRWQDMKLVEVIDAIDWLNYPSITVHCVGWCENKSDLPIDLDVRDTLEKLEEFNRDLLYDYVREVEETYPDDDESFPLFEIWV